MKITPMSVVTVSTREYMTFTKVEPRNREPKAGARAMASAILVSLAYPGGDKLVKDMAGYFGQSEWKVIESMLHVARRENMPGVI